MPQTHLQHGRAGDPPAPAPPPSPQPLNPVPMTWQYVVLEIAKLVVPVIGLAVTGWFAYRANEQSKQNSQEINAARETQAYHETQLNSIGEKVDEAKRTAKKVADKVGADKITPKRVGEE